MTTVLIETICRPDPGAGAPVPIELVPASELAAWRESQPARVRRWSETQGLEAKAGGCLLVPGADGSLERVIAVTASSHGNGDPCDSRDPWACAHLPALLPGGRYRLAAAVPAPIEQRLAIGWALAQYAFGRYKSEPAARDGAPPRLVVSDPDALALARSQVAGVELARDLINTPAADMMPEHLSAAARELAEAHGARWVEIVGGDLLERGFPAVHAVGRASAHDPRLIDLRWEPPAAGPTSQVTLVGKGVCFDSGGLDLKTASGMRLMKKDMGGAAHALGLARMIMGLELPVRLRVLIPAVENAVSGPAYRPGDVLRTRAGLSVEIENTDAEGRVVLSDALAEAGSERPDLVVDFATLTGAARIALGTDLPALFSNDDTLAAGLARHGEAEWDPTWRLPLHRPYRELIESRVADLANAAAAPYAGAITAALFLERFVPAGVSWAHLDLMAWNLKARPGRPEGGEAMGLRGLLAYLRERYAPATS